MAWHARYWDGISFHEELEVGISYECNKDDIVKNDGEARFAVAADTLS